MSRQRHTHLAVVAVMLTVPFLAQAQQRANTIEGVWQITERATTGANAATITNVQPNLYIFTRGHYSLQRVTGNVERPSLGAFKDPLKPTDAEKLGRFDHWNLFTSNGGTYTLRGTTLTTHPFIAKNRSVEGVDQTFEVKIEANTFWIISRSAEGQPVSETRTKLTRVE